MCTSCVCTTYVYHASDVESLYSYICLHMYTYTCMYCTYVLLSILDPSQVEDVPGVDNVEIQKSSEESSLENQSESAEFKTPEAVSLHEESLMMDDLLLEHSSLKLYMECEVFEGEIEHLEMMIKVRKYSHMLMPYCHCIV